MPETPVIVVPEIVPDVTMFSIKPVCSIIKLASPVIFPTIRAPPLTVRSSITVKSPLIVVLPGKVMLIAVKS